MLDRTPSEVAKDIAEFMLKTGNYGLSDRTLTEQRVFVAACVLVIAIALGICSLEGIDTAAGKIAFASSGWLTLGLVLLCGYLAGTYFFAYWSDRSSYSYRKHLAIEQHGINRLLEYINEPSAPNDEQTKAAIRSALDDANSRAARTKYYYQIIYLYLPLVFLIGAIFTLFTQAPWSFKFAPLHCN